MRLAVIGASGRIGGSIVREALARGHAVTAVVRNESSFETSQLDGSRHYGADRFLMVAQADVFDPAAIAAAIEGTQVVISAVGHAATLADQGYYVRAGMSLVAAIRSLSASGPRLLVVGGFGSLEVAPGIQLADRGGFRDHAGPETLGQRDALTYYRTVSDTQWTYISPPPGGIRSGERTGSYRTTRDRVIGDNLRESRISTEDFAVAVLDEAERAEHLFACISVAH